MNFVYEKLLNTLKKSDTVIVAVSGGPDSMALLHLLLEIKREKQINVICTHINHNVRKASIKESKFVEKYCIDNKIPFELLKIDKYDKDNFHNEARKIRYNFFENVVLKYNATYLMTAHHADDLIESVLMRITRGSTLRGYAGFEEMVLKSEYNLYRPLIHITKSEILDYCKLNKIKYVLDNSNRLDKYTRNRFRKYVLPFLRKEDKNIAAKFNRFSQKLVEADNYIEKIVIKKYSEIIENEIIDLVLFKKEDIYIQKRILNIMLENKLKEDINMISDTNVLDVLDLINNKKTSGQIDLPGISLVKSYDKLMFKGIEKDYEYKYELKDELILPNKFTISKVNSSLVDSNFIVRFNSNELVFPLFVRTVKNGDRINLKGMKGSKKINDIFIDRKIDRISRKSWPIVVDSLNNIIWIPGLKKSNYSKTKDESHDIILKYH